MNYVIIGNSTAAIAGVEGIREVDSQGEIVLISRETHHTYSKPLISYYLAGKVSRENMDYRPADFYARNRVKTYLGQEVTSINPETKTVHLEPEDVDLSYERLLIATGGSPIVPPVFRGDYLNLHQFYCLDDVLNLSRSLEEERPRKIAIIGGGLIGLKAAESMVLRKQHVIVIEAGPYLLGSIMDREGAALVHEHLVEQGIEFYFSRPVIQLETGARGIEGLILEDHTVVACDMVLLAAGVRAAYPPTVAGGLKTDLGILVDNYMQTSIPGIFAAGDVAQGFDMMAEVSRPVPILSGAYRQGRIAGLNMAGQKKESSGIMAFNSIPLLGLNIATAGLSTEVGDDFTPLSKTGPGKIYQKLILKENRIHGLIFVGDISRAGMYRGLMTKKADISSYRQHLLSSDFGLKYLPEEYIEEVL